MEANELDNDKRERGRKMRAPKSESDLKAMSSACHLPSGWLPPAGYKSHSLDLVLTLLERGRKKKYKPKRIRTQK